MVTPTPDALQLLASLVSGLVVGFSLGLVGGGGSVLAVPLLVYFVKVGDPHVAIGTSAVSVAANALASLANHARAGSIKWRCAGVFAVFGVVGAFAGSTLGKMMDGERLLALFALLMLAVGALMFRQRGGEGYPQVRLGPENFFRLAALGFIVGGLSGFFGIGGGFLIVPGLMLAADMPILNAIGSSLVSVTAFGVTTAANYALSDYVAWKLAGGLIAGGVVGSLIGVAASRRLAHHRGALNVIFAGLVIAVALYVLWRSAGAFWPTAETPAPSPEAPPPIQRQDPRIEREAPPIQREAPTDSAPPPAKAPAPRKFVVAPGDTLQKIARRVYGDPRRWTEIAAANPDAVANRLKIGAELTIP